MFTPDHARSTARRILFAACVLALCVLVSESQARDVGALGGVGGTRFDSKCRAKDVIIGFNIRSGNALDAVVPICIALNPQRTEWMGEAYEPTQYFGGGGGVYEKLACDLGDAVRGIEVWAGKWGGDIYIVKYFRLTCQDLASGFSYQVLPREGTIGHSPERKSLPCASGEWGTGIYGRSGQFVDRLGFICERP